MTVIFSFRCKRNLLNRACYPECSAFTRRTFNRVALSLVGLIMTNKQVQIYNALQAQQGYQVHGFTSSALQFGVIYMPTNHSVCIAMYKLVFLMSVCVKTAQNNIQKQQQC